MRQDIQSGWDLCSREIGMLWKSTAVAVAGVGAAAGYYLKWGSWDAAPVCGLITIAAAVRAVGEYLTLRTQLSRLELPAVPPGGGKIQARRWVEPPGC